MPPHHPLVKVLPVPRSQTGIIPKHDEVHLRDREPATPEQLSLAIKMYKPQVKNGLGLCHLRYLFPMYVLESCENTVK